MISKVTGLFETSAGMKKIDAVRALLGAQISMLYDKILSPTTLMSLLHQEYRAGGTDYFEIPDAANHVLKNCPLCS